MVTEVEPGHYHRKQIDCKSRIIAWSHASRFRLAENLVGSEANRKILDYGCGDGTFLERVAHRFTSCVGADIEPGQIEDCKRRFKAIANVRFCTVPELNEPEYTNAFDIVTCMETLEHCVEPIVDRVLVDLKRLCAKKGRIIISVPVEIGPIFFMKYALRKIAAWRGLSDYAFYENYSLGHGLRMLFATSGTHVPRPVYGEPGSEYLSHYGFNWRRLRLRVEHELTVERICFSPLGVLGGWVSSQAWFICRLRD
jgi:SAM-dependent methyltransferase